MNDKYSEAVEARLGRSRAVVAFVAVAGAFTTGLMLALPLPPGLEPLPAAWAACATLHALDRALRPRCVRVALDGSATVDGIDGTLRHPCFVAPWLTVIRWRPAVPGMLPAEDFRRLRVLLAWR